MVTSTADTVDGTCDSSCTLREAITAVNAAEGTDTINFALPGPAPYTITLSQELPPTDHVLIDGLSQSGATATSPNVFLSGGSSVDEAISVAQTTIRGIGVIGFQGFSARAIELRDDNHIYASVIGFVPGQPAPAPAGEGIVITGDNNIVGTNGDGVNDASEHNVISGWNVAIMIWGGNNRIANNYIGTNIAGTAAIPNGSTTITNSGGIRKVGPGNGTLIGTNADGTSDALERNVISGNARTAVSFGADAGDGAVRGNFIGVDASGTSPLPNGNGIEIDTSNIVIGGTAPVAGNVIAHSRRPAPFNPALGHGVAVGQDQSETPVGIVVRGNSIFGNGTGNLGMRGGGGPNDALDADEGVNGIQNYPNLFAQTNQASGTTIEGTLASKPNQSYDIDIYKATCASYQDLLQYRGTETYLGSVTVQTDDAGSADIM
ncbi:MAG: CSLREA domain-containing protein, partial [Actinomycetota bacterium]|nr:CSLREA domain-containing protein [Actinomycetota bacterium]